MLPVQCWVCGCSTHPVWGVDVHTTVDEVLHDVRVPSPGGHMEGCAEKLEGGEDRHQKRSASIYADPTRGQPWPFITVPCPWDLPGTPCPSG